MQVNSLVNHPLAVRWRVIKYSSHRPSIHSIVPPTTLVNGWLHITDNVIYVEFIHDLSHIPHLKVIYEKPNEHVVVVRSFNSYFFLINTIY